MATAMATLRLRADGACDGSSGVTDASGDGRSRSSTDAAAAAGETSPPLKRQRGAPPEGEPEWSLALSSADRVAALEQIREELDFDALFDEDVEEVAKLTAHELAELEKTRFGHAVGDTPDWGIPGRVAGLPAPPLPAPPLPARTSATQINTRVVRNSPSRLITLRVRLRKQRDAQHLPRAQLRHRHYRVRD